MDDVACPLCHDVLEDPIKCPCACGKTVCRVCFMHALSATEGRCPFTRQTVAFESIVADDDAIRALQNHPCSCAYTDHGCSFTGTLAECEAHERRCPNLRVIQPGYYQLHHCDDNQPERFDSSFIANDMLFSYDDEYDDGRHFSVRHVYGMPWFGKGMLRRNRSAGFYIWCENMEEEGTVAFTAIRVLPSGDFVGRVRGDADRFAHWTYRSVYVGPSPPPMLDEGDNPA